MIMIVELKEKILAAERMDKVGFEPALSLLEEAHIISQPFAWPHVYVHWKMLLLAFRFRQWGEFFGQIPRILLAAPGSILGKAPRGNVGSTKMGIFEERL